MVEITDSVKFASKFEDYLAENCIGQFSFEQRASAGRALLEMIDEMEMGETA